jgi:hypothetical protein
VAAIGGEAPVPAPTQLVPWFFVRAKSMPPLSSQTA